MALHNNTHHTRYEISPLIKSNPNFVQLEIIYILAHHKVKERKLIHRETEILKFIKKGKYN